MFPRFTWDKIKDGKEKDPINIIFKNSSLKKILKHFDSYEWRFRGNFLEMVSDQYTPDYPPRTVQNAQRVKGNFWHRFHMRIWNYKENYHICSVHEERFALYFGYVSKHPKFPIVFDHIPYGFEVGKENVEKLFNTDIWIVRDDLHNLGNATSHEYGNGHATEIEEKK